MIRKDHFLKEIQKIAEVLARLLDFKKQGNQTAYQQLYHDTLSEQFSLDASTIAALPEDQFRQHIEEANYSPEKLDGLAKLLHLEAQHQQGDEKLDLLRKVLLIFDVLEHKHHWQSFENIAIRNTITKVS